MYIALKDQKWLINNIVKSFNEGDLINRDIVGDLILADMILYDYVHNPNENIGKHAIIIDSTPKELVITAEVASEITFTEVISEATTEELITEDCKDVDMVGLCLVDTMDYFQLKEKASSLGLSFNNNIKKQELIDLIKNNEVN